VNNKYNKKCGKNNPLSQEVVLSVLKAPERINNFATKAAFQEYGFFTFSPSVKIILKHAFYYRQQLIMIAIN